MNMQNLNDTRGGTFALSKAGLAEGTSAATIKTAAPNGAGTDYAIEGFAYHKADTDNIAMTALAVQAALTKCLYAIQINAAGTVSMKKGTEQLTASLSAGLVTLDYPTADDDNVVLGYLKVETAAATTFTSGTTDLSAAGITATFYDTIGTPVGVRTS